MKLDHHQTKRATCGRTLRKLAAASDWSPNVTVWHAAQVDRFFDNLGTFERRMSKPKQHRTRRLRDCMFTSYSGALCAFLQEAHKRGLKHLKPLSPEQLEQHLRSALPTKRIFDHAVIMTQTKANGKKRITLSPGQKIRIANRLAADILEASGVANPFEFCRAGKGPHAAIAEIVRLAEEEGVRDFVVFDLENYFTSVDAKHLTGVPLPKRVMRHAVCFNRHVILLHSNINAAEVETARHGLPQGARASGIIASSLLGRELRQLDGAKGIVTFVDDGVLGACDPAGANSLAEATKLRLAKIPGGPLSFKRLDVVSIEQGFQFLGYYLRLDAMSEVPKVFIQPSHEARAKFRRRLMRKLGSISPKPDWDQASEVAHRYAKQWRQSFPLWKPSEAKLFEFEGMAESFADDFLSGFISKHGPPPKLHGIVGKSA